MGEWEKMLGCRWTELVKLPGLVTAKGFFFLLLLQFNFLFSFFPFNFTAAHPRETLASMRDQAGAGIAASGTRNPQGRQWVQGWEA